MMHLPPPPWEESKGGGVANNGLNSLVTALSQQRNSRELSLQLRVGLRDAGAEFSYVRMRGIRRLSLTVETAAGSEDWAAFFHESQLYPQLQIVGVLFTKSLAPPRHDSEQAGEVVWQRSTEEEVVAGLHLLEGCCILDPSSRSIAARHSAVKHLLGLLEGQPSVALQPAALDALLATLIDCRPSIQSFGGLGGLSVISRMMCSRHYPLSTRLKCADFLQMFMGQVLRGVYGEGGGEGAPPWSREDALKEASGVLGSAVAATLRDGEKGAPAMGDLRRRSQHMLELVK